MWEGHIRIDNVGWRRQYTPSTPSAVVSELLFFRAVHNSCVAIYDTRKDQCAHTAVNYKKLVDAFTINKTCSVLFIVSGEGVQIL